MKLRSASLLVVLALLLVAFRPVTQDAIPARPTIRLDAGDVIAEEDVYSYCWTVAQGNNQCGFADDLGFANPRTPIEINADQQLNVIIDNSPGDPISLILTVDPDGSTVQTYTLESAPLAIFAEPLPPGAHILQVDAFYDVAGSRSYISYRFAVTVRNADGSVPEVSPTTVRPTSTRPPTSMPTATQEIVETEEPVATEDLLSTAEVAATEEIATEEAGATQEAALAGTDEAAAIETEAVAETEEPRNETAEPEASKTEEAPAGATATPTTTTTPQTQPSATPTQIPVSPTAPAVATTVAPATTTAASGATTPQVASGATSTTVPLGGFTTEVASAPTVVTVEPTAVVPQATPTATATTPIAQPTEPPPVHLVFAGITYDPVGVNFCQTSETSEEVCVNRPLSSEGQAIILLQGAAIQVHLVSTSRPESITFTFQNADTLADVQTTARRGDRLVLFNIDAPLGTYILRVGVDWGATEANYFFRVRVQ